MGSSQSNINNLGEYVKDVLCTFSIKDNNKLDPTKSLYVIFDYYPYIVSNNNVNNFKYNILNTIYSKDNIFENKMKEIISSSIKYCNYYSNSKYTYLFDVIHNACSFIVKKNQDGEDYVEIFLKMNIRQINKVIININKDLNNQLHDEIYYDGPTFQINKLSLDDIRLGIYHSFNNQAHNRILKLNEEVNIKMRQKDIFNIEVYQKNE